MKVMNLRCAHDHRFEGWFASDAEMHAQLDEGRLACPLCGDGEIVRLPSAPHVVLSGGRGAAKADAPRRAGPVDGAADSDAPAGGRELTVTAAPASAPDDASVRSRQAAWLQRLRQVVAATDDVGDRFAVEARRIHHGEAEERAIRGQATPAEARALVEEGIEIVALPMPEALKRTLQ